MVYLVKSEKTLMSFSYSRA